ncbi:putative lipid-binding transport protein (Tim44 family) [Pelomonas saccharophila]|uniref:Lipid-binding transport protein (Tim44 family) n=1 Tax=Roseateles saccharophilus TaxID=304 RepID=A0ABU1YFM4_ROSSA|nr:Tim44-like domain-containing protein [Roseateles saccharophilus]MDR7267623.1 putative lipid-binding transport protein (Tim44 family) [Roseateles saccharophilus]
MNRILAVTLAALLAVALPVHDAEAKRLSGGGMKRSVPTQTTPQTPPAQQPAPQQAAPNKQAAATPAAPAAAPKRSWLGPIAGLAAGLGLAALASHFGLGGELASLMTLLLLGIVAVFVIRFLVRRFASPKPQLAGANGASLRAAEPAWIPAPMAAASAATVAPADFDTEGFEKLAKQVFIRLQAANDAGDQADLRRFTTPQMYASIQHDLLERGAQTQSTEVLQLDARVVDVATEDGQQIVSVRFSGLVREKSEQAAEDFDEVWHLVKAGEGWLIAGIQQTA